MHAHEVPKPATSLSKRVFLCRKKSHNAAPHTVIFSVLLAVSPDTAAKNAKADPAKPAGAKLTDGQGLYLLVKSAGKYWRFDYRFADKRKTLALGIYPAVTLADARKARDTAREFHAMPRQGWSAGYAHK